MHRPSFPVAAVLALMALIALVTFSSPAEAVRGRLEASFGKDGFVYESFNHEFDPGYLTDSSFGIAIERNPITGKLMMVASVTDSDLAKPIQIGLARYHPDGTLDESFGSGNVAGLRLLDWQDPRTLSVDNALFQPDGKLLFTAFVYEGGGLNPVDRVVCRVAVAGNLDPGFGTDGCTLLQPLIDGPHYFTNQLALDASGRIYFGGRRSDGYPAVLRLDADGDIDIDFGLNGLFYAWPQGATGALLDDIAIRPDGRILLFGSGFYNDRTRWFVMEATSDGDVNASFGPNDGIHVITYGDPDPGSGQVGAMSLLDDGRVALFGRGRMGGNDVVGAIMLSADGKTIDPTWGTALLGSIPMGPGPHILKAMQLPDGGFAVSGYTSDNGEGDPLMIVVDALGMLDLRFNRDGIQPGTMIIPVDATSGMDTGKDYAVDMAWSEGRLILAGQAEHDGLGGVAMLVSVEMHDGLFKDGLED
ncbi:MAG: hypothetical protein KDI75_05210 [Xanthomonadales bacterium]|nr:hypothetical protein [Xanthomonadales bacterium]